MSTLAEVFLRVRGDVQVRKDVDRDVKKIDGTKAGKHVGSGFSKGFKGALAGVGSAFAAVGVSKFFMSTIEEAREAGRVTRLTNAVLKSTGGVAKVSAADVGRLADTLSKKNAIDDELIQSGANLLLTFTRVRNEAGKGNDIFNQGVSIATDMSVALGKDMKGSVTLVGKALNDPIKGLTALSKVGVSFTQKQKDQIKAMVESGNTMGAQKLILKELKTEFGGAGAAAVDPAQKAKVAWENFQESVGQKILPILGKLATWFTEKALPAIEKFIQASVPYFKSLVAILKDHLVPAFQAIAGWISRNRDAAVAIGAVILGVVIAMKAWSAAVKIHAVFVKAHTVAIAIWHGLTKAITIATRVWAAVQWVLNAAMRANPIGIIVTLLVLLVGAVILAYKKSETFRNIVQGAWKGIQAVVSVVWNWMKGVFASFMEFLQTLGRWANWLWQNVMLRVWHGIQGAIAVAWSLIKTVFDLWMAGVRTVGSWIGWLWNNVVVKAFEGIRIAISFAWGIIKPIFDLWMSGMRTVGSWIGWLWQNVVVKAFTGIRVAISFAWSLIKTIFDLWMAGIRTVASWLGWLWRNVVIKVWNGIKDAISIVWNGAIWPIFRTFRDVLTKTIPDAFNKGKVAIEIAWTAIRNFISTTWNKYIWPIFRTFRDVITKTIPNAFQTGVKAISGWWSKLGDLIKVPINWVISYVINRGIIENINKVKKLLGIGGKSIGWVPTIGSSAPKPALGGSVAGKAMGGVIRGYRPGVDTEGPYMLSKGEAVMRPEWTRLVGRKAIDRWNKKSRMGGFAKGGVVGGDAPVGGPMEDFNALWKIFQNPLGWLTEKVGLGRIKDKIKDGPWQDVIVGVGKKVLNFGVEKLQSLMSFWEGFGGGVYLGRDPSRSISAILSVAKRFYSGARVSSGYRPGDPGYHGRGLAADLIGGGAGGMKKIAAGFMGMSGRLLELIHSNGSYFVKNGKRVGASYYRSVIGQHYNHVHVAARRDALLKTNIGSLVGSGQLGAWVSAAMALTGTSPSWFAALVALAKHESGGNPRAQNNWDSNAAAGHPSKGLFQTIDSTFNRWKLPGLGNIWNPVHNAVAAIRYIKNRYGSIFKIPSYRAGNRFVGGYELGGIVPRTGFARVHRGEEVLSIQDRRQQLSALYTVVDRLEQLIAATENVGPAVGYQLTGGVASARTLARGRVVRR